MYRSELVERIGLRLKRVGLNPVARNSITQLVMEEFKDIINEQIDSVIEVSLLTLHDDFGFGKSRVDNFINGISSRIDSYYDDYGLDTVIKFQQELKRRGIDYKTSLDTKKEKINGREHELYKS